MSVAMFTLGALLSTPAEASEAPAPVVDPVTYERAAFEYERGRRRVKLGAALAVTGAGVGAVGAGVAVVGMIAGFAGNDALGLPVFVAGATGVVAGGALAVSSPFVIGSGMAIERRSLGAMGAEPPRWAGRAATASLVGGAALGLLVPPVALVGAGAATGFAAAQQSAYDRTFREVRIAPVVSPEGAGVSISGRF